MNLQKLHANAVSVLMNVNDQGHFVMMVNAIWS